MISFPETVDEDTKITVIAENQLSLSGAMGNDYQGAHISFTFQAFAIAEASFDRVFTAETTKAQKAEEITRAVYESQGCTFLSFN